MDEYAMRDALLNFVRQFVDDFRVNGDDIEIYRTRRDDFNAGHPDRFLRLHSFEDAVSLLDASPLLQSRYPPNAAKSLTQRFGLLFLSSLDRLEFEQNAFDNLFNEFWSELIADQWIYCAVSILYNFEGEAESIDLGDDISILCLRESGTVIDSSQGTVWYPQVSDDIAHDLRLGRWQLDELNRDALNARHGHHIIVATHRFEKTRDVSVNSPPVAEKLNRALLALRMLKEGDIGNGPVHEKRLATFYWDGGSTSLTETTGAGRNHPRLEYVLNESEVDVFQRLYRRIKQFDTTQSVTKPVWRNVAVAERAFNLAYSRGFFRAEDEILDLITAIEALIVRKDSGEFAFTLAFRSASLLARSDDERSGLFEAFKTFYDTRSKIVHGDELKGKHLNAVENRTQLRSLVRQLLNGFLWLATAESWAPKRIEEFYARIDKALLHAQRRDELRSWMGNFTDG